MATCEHIGMLPIPKCIADYVEKHGLRLITEQTSFDAVNGYALGIGSRITVQQFVEYCPICGWDSIRNPNQKRMVGEQRHKIVREWETIFEWDDYGPYSSTIDQAWEEAVNG